MRKLPLHNDPDPNHTAEALDLMDRVDALDWKRWVHEDCTLTEWYRVPTWIEDVFLKPKETRIRIIERLDTRFGLAKPIRKGGRKRKHKNHAARQKAYLARKRDETGLKPQ